jgi:aminopeptidase N
VTGLNLTRDEARTRARLLAVDAYDVHLDLTTGDKTFRSETLARFRASEAGASVRIDLAADSVRSVTLNGVELDPFEISVAGGLRLPDLAADNELRVVADCLYMHTGEGMHRFVDPADGEVYLYTQFEANEAHRVYACFDQPDLKAVFNLTVDGPEAWTVLSNEPVTSMEPLRDGVSRWTFAPTPKVSTYITVICAGPFYGLTDTYDRADGTSIPLGFYCRASLGSYLDPDELIELTRQGFAFFEEQFGRRYPFTKYDQVGVAEFNAGAMENSGCVTFHEDYFVFRSKVTDALRDSRANTLLHEMAHMWFGDLVTMRWWDDLWLNESFAEFMAYDSGARATRFASSWTSFATGRKAWGYRQDQLPSTHPIVADAPDIETVKANFDGITYAKGASVLRQLVAWVGADEFMAGLRAYFDKHAWGNTTLADLLVELEETSGRDLTLWSKEWLETAGCNTLRPEYELSPDGTYTSLSVLQDAPADHPTLRSHRIAIGLYDREGEHLVRRRRVEIDVEGSRTQVPELVGEHQPDLLLVNDDDLTFAKIRLDERSLRTLSSGLGRLESSLARALCWSAAWDMTRDAEMRGRDFVTLVANRVGAETDITTVQTVLGQATLAIDVYVDPAQAETSRRELAASLTTLIQEAEPESDLQLAYVRALGRAASTPEALDLLSGLLDGSVVLEGLVVDADLRWRLIRRLVQTGRLSDPAIDAELANDVTSNGQREAATVRAARPTAEAKAEAWRAVVDQDELPNSLQAATILGFADPAQPDLLRPYVQRYFDSVADVWEQRTIEMASNVAIGLFPGHFVEQGTVDLTTAYLDEHPDLAPALARLLAEGRDGIERALRARAADRA